MKPLYVLAFTTGILLGGCASNAGPDSELRSRAPEKTSVQVSNNNWLDVNVFAVRGDQRVRLGMVTSMSTKLLRVPGAFLSGPADLQLIADPIGSSMSYSSEPINVWPGQTITLAVENQLSLSHVVMTAN